MKSSARKLQLEGYSKTTALRGGTGGRWSDKPHSLSRWQIRLVVELPTIHGNLASTVVDKEMRKRASALVKQGGFTQRPIKWTEGMSVQ